MNLLIRRNNSCPNNKPIWHASFTSFQHSLTASCIRIHTASITWTSRTAQSWFTPVHMGFRSRNGTHSNASLIISSRLASWNAVVLLNGHPVLSSFPRRMAAFNGYPTSVLSTNASRGKLSVNPCKCEWAVPETNFLGYWLTPNGLKPWRKKIDTILQLQCPCTVKDLRSFIGAVTYYCTMFPKRAHILAPLIALTSQKSGNVAWSAECQQAFDTIKGILSSDVLLRYPDHNKPFHVYTDTSDLQLGAVIVPDN